MQPLEGVAGTVEKASKFELSTVNVIINFLNSDQYKRSSFNANLMRGREFPLSERV